MHDASFAGDEPSHMNIGGDAQELVKRRLAGAMIADGKLTHANDGTDVDDVVAHTAGQGSRRNVIATGVAVGRQTLFAQAADLREYILGAAGRVIGAKKTNNGGDARACVAAQSQRRHSRAKAALAAAAGHVYVAIDETGHHASSLKVDKLTGKRRWHCNVVATHPRDGAVCK